MIWEQNFEISNPSLPPYETNNNENKIIKTHRPRPRSIPSNNTQNLQLLLPYNERSDHCESSPHCPHPAREHQAGAERGGSFDETKVGVKIVVFYGAGRGYWNPVLRNRFRQYFYLFYYWTEENRK